ncbi:hypothetical protein Thermus77420_23970 [Thermus thalpophilus]
MRNLRASPVTQVVDLKPISLAKGLFFPFGLPPGNARETWGEALLLGLPAVLGDRGFRWVREVRNWIETRFSVMVRSLGLPRVGVRSFWGLLAG